MPRRMVAVAALEARLGAAARLHARAHGVDGGRFGAGELEEDVFPAVSAFVERRRARRASRGSMIPPSCTRQESSASFAASGVKTQAKPPSAVRATRAASAAASDWCATRPMSQSGSLTPHSSLPVRAPAGNSTLCEETHPLQKVLTGLMVTMITTSTRGPRAPGGKEVEVRGGLCRGPRLCRADHAEDGTFRVAPLAISGGDALHRVRKARER